MTRRDYIILGKRMVKQYHVTVYHRSRALKEHAIHETRNIAAPFPPTTARQLYILAHEVGHIVLGHCEAECHKPSFVEEREAEDFAHAELRRLRVPVPIEETEQAESYVAHHRRKYWKPIGRIPVEQIERDIENGYITGSDLVWNMAP